MIMIIIIIVIIIIVIIIIIIIMRDHLQCKFCLSSISRHPFWKVLKEYGNIIPVLVLRISTL